MIIGQALALSNDIWNPKGPPPPPFEPPELETLHWSAEAISDQLYIDILNTTTTGNPCEISFKFISIPVGKQSKVVVIGWSSGEQNYPHIIDEWPISAAVYGGRTYQISWRWRVTSEGEGGAFVILAQTAYFPAIGEPPQSE